MKKAFKISLVVIICLMMTFFLVGCRKEKQEETLSRVTVDINPSIELIVDEENKVVSVTALNDDGNIIIVGETFIGKTAEEAVALIVSIANETGYLYKADINSSSSQAKIQISVSGDELAQEELYNSIKKEVEKVISTNHINALITKKEALQKEALEQIVLELDPTLTEEDVKEMDEQELLKVIQTARLETSILYSEALIKMYNEQKAHQIKLVERAETKELINELDSTYQVIKDSYSTFVARFANAVLEVEDMFYEYFVEPSSTYQEYYIALLDATAELIAQKEKVEQLDDGIEKEIALSILQTKQRMHAQALENLEYAYNYFLSIYNQVVETLKAIEQELIDFEQSLPDEIKTVLTSKAEEIEIACNEVKSSFYRNFEEEYQKEIEYYKNIIVRIKNAGKDKIAESIIQFLKGKSEELDKIIISLE